MAQTIPPARALDIRAKNADGHPADDPAFALLVHRHYEKLVRVVTAMTGDQHLAEDIVQRTFEKAVRKWPAIRHYQRLDSWLYKVALNDTRHHHSRAAREAQALNEAAHTNDLAFDSIASTTTQIDLVRALAQLPPRQREVAALFLLGERSIAQIAQEIDRAPGTVKATWHNARARLTQLLSGYAARHYRKGDAHER